MKKKLLTTAMLAALGGVGTAHAVNVNPDGLGQVLLFPYYTVQNGFVTSVHITNTTSQTKAVKVRFLEGKNSREVLDFNLYLSPYDVWAGRVIGDETGAARLQTVDTSCITPRYLASAGEPFRRFEFVGDSVSEIERTREGYVEVIEMGTLDPDTPPGSYAVHDATGVPDSCTDLVAAENSGSVSSNISAPTGGLFGSGHLIAVNSGIRTSYDAVALDDFLDTAVWTGPGSLSPSLASVNTFATVVDGDELYTDLGEVGGRPIIDRVSALLMKSSINNEYAIDAFRAAKTDWVVTFPTKRFYVNSSPVEPFSSPWSSTSSRSCDDITFEYWDREEQGRTPQGGDFSPQPEIQGFQLCNEVNTLTLHRDGTDADDHRLFGAEYTAAALAIENGFDAGWMQMGFTSDPIHQIVMDDGAGSLVTFAGLPVIGFAAMSAVNSVSVEVDGLTVYSAYMGSLVHKNEKMITSAPATP
tara:strand:+ start:987 stop:2399 length:1413 start_codon:yes stop_codon:yes gene_type:complete